MTTADHCAHVELFYELWLTMARGQAEAMRTMAEITGCGYNTEAFHVLEGMIEAVEHKLETVQNRDPELTQP